MSFKHCLKAALTQTELSVGREKQKTKMDGGKVHNGCSKFEGERERENEVREEQTKA